MQKILFGVFDDIFKEDVQPSQAYTILVYVPLTAVVVTLVIAVLWFFSQDFDFVLVAGQLMHIC